MLCEPVCHRLSGRNQSKKKHACQADVLFILCQGFWLFSVFRRSRLRGHRQIRRCDLHRSHRRDCRRSCRLRRNRPAAAAAEATEVSAAKAASAAAAAKSAKAATRGTGRPSRLLGRAADYRRRSRRCCGGLGPPCGGRGPPERGGRGPRGGRRPQKMG